MRPDGYDEYITILSSFGNEHIRTYHTDGGHSPNRKSTGLGIKIVKHKHWKEHVLLMLSDGLESATISDAKLIATYEALRWLQHA